MKQIEGSIYKACLSKVSPVPQTHNLIPLLSKNVIHFDNSFGIDSS